MAAALVLLAGLSAVLAARRVYQADECQTVTMARVDARAESGRYFTDASLATVALAPLMRADAPSRVLFARARAAMLVLFWANLLLLALCAEGTLASRQGLTALLAAATLAPLWDYGFEVRHDNLLLSGLLLSWLVLRARPRGRLSYLAAGALAAAMQFAAFKSFAFWVPLSAAFLLFPPPGHRAPRGALAASWLAGAALAFSAGRLLYGALGLWPSYAADFSGMAGAAARAARFGPWRVFGRALVQTPLLSALALFALWSAARDLSRRGRAALGWEGSLPEAVLLAGAILVLCADPTPYGYNILFVTPFAFLLAWREARARGGPPRPGAALLALHLVPFAAAVAWESAWTNARQVRLMDAAEALTAPGEPVYDAMGLVPSRPPAVFHWFDQSLVRANFTDGAWPPVRAALAKDPPPVVIPNYRTDWLSGPDRDFLLSRWAALSDDFRVLAAVVPAGGGAFTVLRAGRYRVSDLSDSGLGGTTPSGRPLAPGSRLDGVPFAGGVAVLSAGPHRLRSARPAAAVWMGPSLSRPPFLGWRDRRRLFVDWY